MMETIGTRRVVILSALAGINLLMIAAIYLWIGPQNDYYTSKTAELKQKASASRAHVQLMTTQLETIQKLKESYGKMQNAGFFATQDRADARDRILAVQKYSRVLTASYDIKPAISDNNSEKLKTAKQVILSTPVDISVEALDDLDLYNFVNLIKNGLPGYVTIDSIEVTRVHDLDDEALHSIASGALPKLINGKVSFTWKTIADDSSASAAGDPAKTGI